MMKCMTLLKSLCLFCLMAQPVLAGVGKREQTEGERGISSGSGNAGRIDTTPGTEQARAVVRRIVAAIGLPMTIFDVRASRDVVNAVARTEDNGRRRLIIYNPSWMSEFSSSVATDWARWVVLAHEVGHHVAFHMDPQFPNHEAELQADYFAGFILRKLGAPRSDVLLAIAMVASDVASATHPSKAERVAKIKEGWEAAGLDAKANIIPASPAPVAASRPPAVSALKLPQAKATGPSIGRPTPKVPEGQKRVAPLIGNSEYEAAARLKNPRNDVIAIGGQLRSLGFSTTIVYDATASQIRRTIQDFGKVAQDADWALVYYSGQGIEVDGVNYMIPVDARLDRFESYMKIHPELRLDNAFEAVKSARLVRLVIADACRDDPFTGRGHVKGERTLRVVVPPQGVLVAYSTGAGQTAADGTGNLSVYAESLLQALREPGIELSRLFRRVSARVRKESNGQQIPTVIGNWPDEDVYVSR